jgi:hypothetical protein
VICSNPTQAPGPSSKAPAASNGKTVLEDLGRGRHVTTRNESSYCVSPICLNSETYHVLVMKREKRKRLEKALFHRSGSGLIGPSVAPSALIVMSNLTCDDLVDAELNTATLCCQPEIPEHSFRPALHVDFAYSSFCNRAVLLNV